MDLAFEILLPEDTELPFKFEIIKRDFAFEPFYDSTCEIHSGTIESVTENIKIAVAFERKGFIIYGEN
jgi:hypothetical protein